ncbi:Hsp20/alpha crystallin family protein [Haladaptatus pallidirubidus]|uniref:Hsp20/alpha crystallin family protein n=1 Tax=Haladaptatus pallidirubidus TaxID=1008152 RepID=UPI001D104BA7|nr:Hsp20/alpha crystallin family protein [Haladaptatus pallidirubidus]
MVDLADEGDQFVVTADVPGYEKDEIDVQIQNNTLRIRAKHEQEAEEREEALIRSEREHREMRESVTLPEPVDEDNITASCNNGVLTVHLPKKEPTEPGGKKIEVE